MVGGGRPVVIEVRAQAVVVGATEVMARSMPSAADRVGARRGRARSCSHPRPSSTSRTTWRACRPTSGSQSGSVDPGRPSRARAGDQVGDAGARVVGQHGTAASAVGRSRTGRTEAVTGGRAQPPTVGDPGVGAVAGLSSGAAGPGPSCSSGRPAGCETAATR